MQISSCRIFARHVLPVLFAACASEPSVEPLSTFPDRAAAPVLLAPGADETINPPMLAPVRSSSFGRFTGTFAATPNGAAQYSVRFTVPPGRAGLTPELGLSYSSHRLLGYAGLGWDIAGLSSITRCPPSKARHGAGGVLAYTGTDPFCLDGELLVVVPNTTSHGGIEMRTVNNRFARIVVYPGGVVTASWEPARFEVASADGRMQRYGGTAASRRSAGGNRSQAWLLDRVSDRFGNYIEYVYQKPTNPTLQRVNNEDVEIVLSEVRYTGYDGAGGTLSPGHAVEFLYEPYASANNALSPLTGYSQGRAYAIGRRLREVNVRSGGFIVRTYVPGYAAWAPGVNAPAHRSRLVALAERDGQGIALPTLRFGYGGNDWTNPRRVTLALPPARQVDAPIASCGDWNTIDIAHFYECLTGRSLYVPPLAIGDVNGDGLGDLVAAAISSSGAVAYTVSVALAQRTASGISFTPFQTWWNIPAANFSNICVSASLTRCDAIGRTGTALVLALGDVDGDGKADIVAAVNAERWLLRSTGTGFTAGRVADLEGGNWQWLGDFNGDGQIDRLRCSPRLVFEASANRVRLDYDLRASVFSASPYSAATYSVAYDGGFGCQSSVPPGDAIRDGVVELGIIRRPLGGAVERSLLDYRGGVPALRAPGAVPEGVPADVNGDGLRDFVYRDSNGVTDVFVGTGAGFLPALRTPVPPGLPVEMDGDGVADWLELNQSGLSIIGSSGVGFLDPNQRHSLVMAVGDIDGNGRDDVVMIDGQTLLFGNTDQDLLVSVDENDDGTDWTITYAPLNDANTYSPEGCTPITVSRCQQPSAVPVVAAVERWMGYDAPSHRQRFSYAGGVINTAGLGFIGFSSRRVVDEVSAGQRTTEYDLATYDSARGVYPFIGLPVRTVERLAGIEHSETVTPRVRDLLQTYFVFAESTTRSLRDGNVVLAESTHKLELVDDYGGIKKESELDLDGNGTEWRRDITNDVARWSIGKVDKLEEVPIYDNQTAIRRTGFVWDHTLSVLKEERERQDAGGPGPSTLTTAYSYDDFGNITRVCRIAPGGARRDTLLDYREPYKTYATHVTDPMSLQTVSYYDQRFGTLLWRARPGQGIARYAYDGFGRMRTQEAPLGVTITIDHVASDVADSAYIERVTPSYGAAVDTYIDRLGRSHRVRRLGFQGDRVEFRRLYDSNGRESEVWPWHAAAVTPANDERWTMAHDVLGRPLVTWAPGGSLTEHDYGPGDGLSLGKQQAGFRHTIYNGRGHAGAAYRDARGRPVRRVDALGGAAQIRYSVDGPIEVEDANRNLVKLGYDGYGRPTRITDPDAGRLVRTYSVFDEIETVTNALNETTSFAYDKNSRLISTTYANGTTDTFGFDTAANGAGLPAFAQSADGHRIEYAYDSAQRTHQVVRRSLGKAFTWTYDYDRDGRLAGIVYPEAEDGTPFAVNYVYRGDLLEQVIDAHTLAPYWIREAADAAGRATRVSLGNGLVESSGYTPFGALWARRVDRPSTGLVVQDVRYDFDQNGNVINRADLRQAARERLTLDPLDRLTSGCLEAGTGVVLPPARVHRPDAGPTARTPPLPGVAARLNEAALGSWSRSEPWSSLLGDADTRALAGMAQPAAAGGLAIATMTGAPSCQSTTYDAIGNIQTRTGSGSYAYNSTLQELVTVPPAQQPVLVTRHQAHAVTAITNGNTTLSLSYDALGRLRQSGSETFAWSQAGQLRDHTTPQGVFHFEYLPSKERAYKRGPSKETIYGPGFEQRIVRANNGANWVNGDAVSDHYYVVADGHTVAEVARYSSLHVFGGLASSYGSLPSSTLALSNGRSTLTYLHADHLGSIEAETDHTSRLLERRSYDPWGRLRPSNWLRAAIAVRPAERSIGYTGHEDDAETGIVNMWHRMYDPRIGRFLAPDPMVNGGQLTQRLNRYSYAANNPVTHIDPDGRNITEIVMDPQLILARRPGPGSGGYGLLGIDGYYQANESLRRLVESESLKARDWARALSQVGAKLELRGDQLVVTLGADSDAPNRTPGALPLGDEETSPDDEPTPQEAAEQARKYFQSLPSFLRVSIGVALDSLPALLLTLATPPDDPDQARRLAEMDAMQESLTGLESAAVLGVGLIAPGPKTPGPAVKFTKKGLVHVVERHVRKDIVKYADKSKFNLTGRALKRLIAQADGQLGRLEGKYFVRSFDVGYEIGFDRSLSKGTSVLTVVTRLDGTLVTAYPGLP